MLVSTAHNCIESMRVILSNNALCFQQELYFIQRVEVIEFVFGVHESCFLFHGHEVFTDRRVCTVNSSVLTAAADATIKIIHSRIISRN